jgi:hypothetical protein
MYFKILKINQDVPLLTYTYFEQSDGGQFSQELETKHPQAPLEEKN